MNINFVVHSLDKSNMGGVVKVVTDLANIFVENGVDVTIYSIGEIDNLCFDISHKVEIVSLGFKKHSTNQYEGLKKITWFIDGFNVFSKILKEKHNEIWLTTSPPLNLLFSVLKINNSKTKVIGCDHTSTIFSKGIIIDKIKYALLRKIDCMVALTEQDNEFYLKKGINSITIPNPIDIKAIRNFENNRKYIIYVGRFSDEKQPLHALEIFYKSELWKSGKKMRFFGLGILENEMKKFIKDHFLENFVEIITNEKNPDTIYKDAYCLLMTSKIEGFGLVLIEAISRNIPCIAFNVPYGPRNIIIHGENGFLIEDFSIEDSVIILKSSVIIELFENDLATTILKFDVERIKEKWMKVFADNIGNNI